MLDGRNDRIERFARNPQERDEEDPRVQSLDSVIATLNHIELGDVTRIEARLQEIREELAGRELDELVAKLDESLDALRQGDLQTFRRLKATMVSRLGHLR